MIDIIDAKVIELFAGPGGMSEAFVLAGIPHENMLGIEFDEAACETARAAGHTRVCADVTKLDPLTICPSYFGDYPNGGHFSPPCFVAGTPVLTQRGILPIEEVVVGDEVWTHMNRWRKVIDTMSRKAETVAIGPVVCTPDHPFYSAAQETRWDNGIRRYEWDVRPDGWTHASEMQGKYKATPIFGGDVQVDLEDAWLMGRYLADGWVSRDGVCFAVGAGKVEEFDIHVKQLRHTISRSGENCYRYTVSECGFRELMIGLGQGAANKTIPAVVLEWNKSSREALLEGYLSGDGNVRGNGWRATTVSQSLATAVRLLAVSLGFTANISTTRNADTTVIEGRTVNQSNYYQIDMVANDGRYTRDKDGHHWTKQRKEVKPLGLDTVYDLTVEEDHSFTAWGYVVHNCQGFSLAGKGKGREDSQMILDTLAAVRDGYLEVEEAIAYVADNAKDDKSALTIESLRWISDLDLEWVTMEQVPAVLPLWEAIGEVLRAWGYSVWTGMFSAEQFGVPQTRKRAFLAASRLVEVSAPVPTHSKYNTRNPEKLEEGMPKWVSMAEALGWGATERVGFPRRYDGRGEVVEIDGQEYRGRDLRPAIHPAQTVTEKGRSWKRHFMGDVYNAHGCIRPVEAPAPTITASADNGNFQWTTEDNPRIQSRIERFMGSEGKNFLCAAGVTGEGRPRPVSSPGPTITCKGTAYWIESRDQYRAISGNDGIRLTVQEGGILQGFPRDYPWRGNQTKQWECCGNAVPPPFGMHVALAAMGVQVERREEMVA